MLKQSLSSLSYLYGFDRTKRKQITKAGKGVPAIFWTISGSLDLGRVNTVATTAGSSFSYENPPVGL